MSIPSALHLTLVRFGFRLTSPIPSGIQCREDLVGWPSEKIRYRRTRYENDGARRPIGSAFLSESGVRRRTIRFPVGI